ncbi:DUF4174 domain-containing protein [Pseudomarimonas salicorniae]|uniref:DUF4174 domain-containing protein n=1 Tax=Pseudomarimonas salicorniae TaxID=2933270 RepID=A0ABT0GF34_9GAMM|nr:DUF4174 domain-containing protein [Lysobacter sp. CAU 1642]MCK7592635.1 DUF4174 domain-containing protein [Lysobacter sp. CAU 1642]
MDLPGLRLILCLLLGAALLPAGLAPALGGPLADWRWQARLLLVFAPDATHPDLLRQRELVAGAAAGARERELLVIEVAGDEVTPAPGGTAPAAADLRRHFSVPATDFAVLLVGKDGGVKQRAQSALEACALFARIDLMPMRRRESGGSGGACPEQATAD